MATECTTAKVRASNWTLATGTTPGERHVYAAISERTGRHSEQGARS